MNAYEVNLRLCPTTLWCPYCIHMILLMCGTDLSLMANDAYNIASSGPESHFLKDIPAEKSKSTGIYDEINECK